MSKYVSLVFCELEKTPIGFDEELFKLNDEEQIRLYKSAKKPNQSKRLTYEQITDETKLINYARMVPEGCCFIDFDDPSEAVNMKSIIIHSGLKCLILETQHGYHFLFRTPDFYEKELTGATNWFGYKFDCKASTEKRQAVQIMRVCGMTRKEIISWGKYDEVVPEELNTEILDVLPYWLWGKLKDSDLHKRR